MTQRFGAVILAAGKASRFGADKLMADWHGAPVLQQVIQITQAAPVEQIVIVIRPDAAAHKLCAAAARADQRITWVELASDGLSASLQAGLTAIEKVDGCFVFLGDMPLVPPMLAGALADEIGAAFAVMPTYEGHSGHPVLLSGAAMIMSKHLEGDAGFGPLLRQRADVIRYPCDDLGIVQDIDTRADLATLLGHEMNRPC